MYKKEYFFVTPVEFPIGSKPSKDPKNPKLIIDKPINAVYLSLEKQLQLFFQLPGIFGELISFMKSLEKEKKEDKPISNFMQADLWKIRYKNMYDGKLVIPISLFFDDFDTGNCLGSHAGNQKFGGVYIQLLTLPPHLKCKLTNIFVNTIFHSHDRQYCGNEQVFEKAIEELNHLNSKGFEICVDEKIITVYLQCVLIIGDNLGVNQVCGFEGGFNAKYYCRRCRGILTIMRKI